MRLILTCEHASNHIPAQYKRLFVGARKVLNSHRGWDPGSLSLGTTMQRHLKATLFQTRATRLLVDPNRSIGHRNLYSKYSEDLDAGTKQTILAAYYYPHRIAVQSWISSQIQSGQVVLHVSLHTFVPKLNGETRKADVGLLYDPSRRLETAFCHDWRLYLATLRPETRVRRNYPYRGTADGLTTHLRKRFSGRSYFGIELEVNQRHVDQPGIWKGLAGHLAESLGRTIAK